MTAPRTAPTESPEEPLLVSVQAAAALLGSSDQTVRRLIDAGQLPVVRLGKRVERVPLAALRAFAEGRREGPVPVRPVVLKPVRQYTRRAGR